MNTVSANGDDSPYDVTVFSNFRKLNPEIAFVFIQWLDYMATIRTRITPVAEFERLIQAGSRLGISYGNLGTLQNDTITSVCNPVGQIYVQPDLASLRPAMARSAQAQLDSATVLTFFTDESGRPLDLCPRSSLRKILEEFSDKWQVNFLVGFEIEVIFLQRTDDSAAPFKPMTANKAWGTMTDEQFTTSLPLLLEITTALEQLGISVQQVHSESGAGQYEFILPPLPPLQAVDTLVQARQCIHQVTARHGLRATLHPMPFQGTGTAAHAHMSFNSTVLREDQLEKIESACMASVLEHLPAICAFTMPEKVSYNRVADNTWTSGIWVCWGTQNREVPLRKVTARRWEIRCLDGIANMYLALGAILGAGLAGVQTGKEMKLKDCQGISHISFFHELLLITDTTTANANGLTSEQRADLGIHTKLPASIDDALRALGEDEQLDAALSPGLVKHYLAMKHAEQTMLAKMSDAEQRTWLIERY